MCAQGDGIIYILSSDRQHTKAPKHEWMYEQNYHVSLSSPARATTIRVTPVQQSCPGFTLKIKCYGGLSGSIFSGAWAKLSWMPAAVRVGLR